MPKSKNGKGGFVAYELDDETVKAYNAAVRHVAETGEGIVGEPLLENRVAN